MVIKWVAIDDEPPALELIKAYAARFKELKLVQVFDDAIAGAEFLRANPVDLLFLDINMPDISGLQLLKSLTNRPATIFTTAYKNYAFDAYQFDALDYLLKPIEYQRFERAVNKVLEYFRHKQAPKQEDEGILFVRSEYQLVKVELDKIEYIESLEDYVKFHFSSGHPLMALFTMKALAQKLPGTRFVRIHRSYIVPVAKIKTFVNGKVRLTSVELPVSATYIDELRKKISSPRGE